MPQQAGEERWRWLHGQLRAAILDRRLRPGARMPSSRNLAKQHGVSRGFTRDENQDAESPR